MGAFRALAEQTGAAFNIIHHERKGSGSSDDRDGDKIRGSSSIEGALDWACRVTRKQGEDVITMHSVKERDQPIRPMSARFHFVQGTNGELIEAWFTGEDADTLETRVQKAIMRLVGNGTCNQTQILSMVPTEVEVGKPTILKVLNWLVEANRLITSSGPRGSIIYQKPTTKQLGLDKFEDIVHYNREIIPTHGSVDLLNTHELEGGAK